MLWDLAQGKYLKIFQGTFLDTFVITLWMYNGWKVNVHISIHDDIGYDASDDIGHDVDDGVWS
jgi:hypothetical protein